MKFLHHLILLVLSFQGFSQSGILTDTVTAKHIRLGMNHIYNLDFDIAQNYYDSIQSRYPDHPVIPFFLGMLKYWQHFPVIPGGPGSDDFISLMDSSRMLAQQMLLNDKYNIEGVFFDLSARSFLIMYYADNGMTSKAILHLGPVYRQLLKGFELEEQFNEFYFFTGLYNYYIEAYPEAHPVYRPVTFFFRKGDKDLGLKTLDYTFKNTIFLKIEAGLFLSIIYQGFENNSEQALYYAHQLYQNFPDNLTFTARYTEMLICHEHYDLAESLIDTLFNGDEFNIMKANIYSGLYADFKDKNPEKAKKYYLEGIRMAKPFGPRAGYQLAYAYMGLSKYYEKRGDGKSAKEYYKKARSTNAYPYVYEKFRN